MLKYTSIIVLLLCAVAGCGKGHVPLKGKVVFSDDGSPLTLGSVILTRQNFQSRGDLNSKGEFVMESLSARDGLPPGTYQVSIAGAIEYGAFGGMRSVVDPKWTDPETSGKTIEVDRKTKVLELTVDRNPASKPAKK